MKYAKDYPQARCYVLKRDGQDVATSTNFDDFINYIDENMGYTVVVEKYEYCGFNGGYSTYRHTCRPATPKEQLVIDKRRLIERLEGFCEVVNRRARVALEPDQLKQYLKDNNFLNNIPNNYIDGFNYDKKFSREEFLFLQKELIKLNKG